MTLGKFMKTDIYKYADIVEYIRDGMVIEYEDCLPDSKVIGHHYCSGYLEIEIEDRKGQ